MSRTRRALRPTCHVVVLLWLAALLAWPRPREEVPEAEPEQARILPRPDAVPSAALPTSPTAVSPREVAEGSRFLEASGRFPVLSSSYADFASFAAYARAMASLGARFVVVRDREIVGSVDPQTGSVGGPDLPRAFSPRARDYTGEPGLAALGRVARERFGEGSVVMMLVPREIDAGLFGGIAGALARRGESHLEFREILARYERGPSGGVRLRVDAAVRLDGSRLAMDLLFDLGQIARVAAAAPGPSA
jgi:hypothetical protein